MTVAMRNPASVADAWAAFDGAMLRLHAMYAAAASSTRQDRLAQAETAARLWSEWQALYLKDQAA